MLKKITNWLIMRKVKNAAGEMEANGISVTKVCALIIGAIQAIEFISPYFGNPIVIDSKITAFIASIGGIAIKEGIDRSAPKS